MEFIEMTGEQLTSLLLPDELSDNQLKTSGIVAQSILRVNRQGDLELRRRDGWDLLGGLLGDFEQRVVRQTGLDWSMPTAKSGQ
ncbi:hypothetical protein [Bythopirellula polymerisocia]|uniref:Uncharacterized protein n=1 Tax=Bythopirellula polymerisocia TaxID=2528003 RepID=A0A5C6CEN7_9BACT|nr:hypothetical protein [Bythopirellula polymerisocia]TWU22728.1 hypothetical protein Pla144_41890 [Bythopirellula polymerisocia]